MGEPAGIPLLEEVADVQRGLARHDPSGCTYLLSATRLRIGDELWRAGRRAEALEAMERAVEAYRRLAAMDLRNRKELVWMLRMLAARQKMAGRHHDARASRREARRNRWPFRGSAG